MIRQAAVGSRSPKAAVAGREWLLAPHSPLGYCTVWDICTEAPAPACGWGDGGSERCVGGVVRDAVCSVASLSPYGVRRPYTLVRPSVQVG
jgi:hypothetical protein